MKALASLIFVPVALAASLQASQHFESMSLESDAPAVATSNSTGANCGVGYTYCGYILKEQKSSPESTALPP